MKFLFFLLLCNICNASINFVHIPKTGGCTLKTLLKRKFPPSKIYPRSNVFGKGVHPWILNEKQQEWLFQRWPKIHHQVVMGHLPIWFFQKMDHDYENSYFITILREPVARVLSHSRFLKRNKRPEHHPLQMTSNVMCKVLCSDCSLEGETLLEDAIQNLERMNFIIFLDDFDNGVRALFKELEFELEHEIPHRNTTRNELVSDEVIEILKQRNALDIRLYEYAKEHYNPETHTLH